MYFLLFLFIRNIFVELNKRTWTPSSSFETTTIPPRVFQLSGLLTKMKSIHSLFHNNIFFRFFIEQSK